MSYFAKPNFIIYDEWFDEDFEKPKIDVQIQKIKPISNIHEFFYKQSNHKIGGSENNLKLDIKVNEKELITNNLKLDIKANKKELITNNYLVNNSEKFTAIANKKFRLFKKITNSNLKFNLTKRLIYSLSIFSFVFIFGFLLFFISQSKNESNISSRFSSLEKEF